MIPMSLVGSEDACSDNSLRAGTPQCNEEQHQMCAKLRNIYQIPFYTPAVASFIFVLILSFHRSVGSDASVCTEWPSGLYSLYQVTEV